MKKIILAFVVLASYYSEAQVIVQQQANSGRYYDGPRTHYNRAPVINQGISQYQSFYSMTSVLRAYRADALRAYRRSPSEALSIFESGLRLVQNSSSAMSMKWVRQSLSMLASVRSQITNDSKSTRLLGLFMDESYQFLINHALDFDEDYYDYSYGYNYVSIRSVADLEKSYIDKTFSYLSNMLNGFVMTDSRGRVYPFGSVALTKSVYGLITKYSSYDLDDSFMAEYYQCESDWLRGISSYLSRASVYSIDRSTLTGLYYDIDGIISGNTCN